MPEPFFIAPHQAQGRDKTSWGRPRAAEPEVTEFELQMTRLNLYSLEDCAHNPKMRAWVRDHCRKRYVPEALLRALDIDLDTEFDVSCASLGA